MFFRVNFEDNIQITSITRQVIKTTQQHISLSLHINNAIINKIIKFTSQLVVSNYNHSYITSI